MTTNYKTARRGAWMAACTGSLLWEIKGMAAGKPMSLSDMTYTTASGIATAWLMYGVTYWQFKRKVNKYKQRFDVSFLPILSDEPLIKKI